MNTLGKSVTTRFFKSPEDYGRLQAYWAEAMQCNEQIPAHIHLTYKALLGRDWTTGFVPNSPGMLHAYATAIESLRWSAKSPRLTCGAVDLFQAFLSPEASALLLEYLDEEKGQAGEKVKKPQRSSAYIKPLHEVPECA